MTYDRPVDEDEQHMSSSMLFTNNDMLCWQSQPQYHHQAHSLDYHQAPIPPTATSVVDVNLPLQAVVPFSSIVTTKTTSIMNDITSPANIVNTSGATTSLMPRINTTNPVLALPSTNLDPTKQYHPEWGVIKDDDFHPLTLKHQRDLENLFAAGTAFTDFYFWQANLGGYCMANMVLGNVVSSEGVSLLERKMVEGAPHPGRRKNRRGLG